ncbi:MAG: TVP38/TMEM64 family protein [Saccharospirillaceae bacterium]|nr:TVP38/TMEM64 family protein [Pseudomonadales bacterium]NRB79324.1 TVP38/TMEM64 family protein [Saccharospirillaceae bacterium]
MKSNITKILILLLLISIVVSLFIFRDQINFEAIQTWLKSLGYWAPVIFIMIYIISTVFFIPGSLLTLASGVLFGPIFGTFFTLIGATIGATISFMISRFLARDWIEKKSGPRLNQLQRGVDKEGWRFIAMVRLVPLFPFSILNYALGLTRIRISVYVITSFICMAPGSLAYNYLGHATAQSISGTADLKQTISQIFIAIGLFAFVLYLPRIIKKFRKEV